MNLINLLVIFGGASSEHSVSRVSASSVIENLNKDKYNIIKVGITLKGEWILTNSDTNSIKDGSWEENKTNKKCILSSSSAFKGLFVLSEEKYHFLPLDVVFPVLHGINGEDGTIQGLFEMLKIPYVGCDVASSALCMDKVLTKIMLDFADIKQAKWFSFNISDYKKEIEKTILKIEELFTYPVFIKPSSTGSSVGISKARNKDELIGAINEAAIYGNKIVVEEFIDGAEIEVAILGNDAPIASICGEIAPARDFYDFEAKYNDDNSLLFIPARIDEKTAKSVEEIAVLAYKALGCCGLSRVDFFVNKKSGEIILNEINTLPGFTSISMYPKLFEHSEINYNDLLDRLITLAFERVESING